HNAPPGQRGAALMAVLVMLALLSGLATIGLDRLRAASASAQEAAELADAQFAAASATALAQRLLPRVKTAAGRDTAAIRRPLAFTLGGRQVTLRFADAGACFNLNTLAASSVADGAAKSLATLMAAAGIPATEAARIAEASRAALGARGILLADVSEWQALTAVPPEAFARLRRLLCTLPTMEAAPFNVNALTDADLPLLLALGLPRERAVQALGNRPEGGWRSMSDFWGQEGETNDPGDRTARLAGTASRWYTASVTVETPTFRIERRLLLDSAVSPARVARAEWVPPKRRVEAA
ncbi:general secretion pathway protein GspK, partial [Thermaurantiacus sp.]